jgi:hypothetical protein
MKSKTIKRPAIHCQAQELIRTKGTINIYSIINKSILTENYGNIIAAEVKND